MTPDTDPTAPDAPPPQGARPPLVRSRSDRVVGGVCAGVARTFGVDPLVVRIATVGLALLAGLGALLYLGALLLMPDEGGEAIGDRSRLLTAVGVLALVAAGGVLLSGAVLGSVGVLVPLALLALAGLGTWWLASGEGVGDGPEQILGQSARGLGLLLLTGALFIAGLWLTGTGSGALAAGLVIAAGLVVVVGAFFRPVRRVVPLALGLALGAGVASAADLDLHGGVGQRTYRPAAAAGLRERYQLGAGRLVVDLRGTRLPAGDVPLDLRVGMGEALLLVPPNVCVASTAKVGAGAVDVLGHDSGGVDVSWRDPRVAPAGRTRVVLDANVGLGAVEVRHRDDGGDGRGGGWDEGAGGAQRAVERVAAARACGDPVGAVGA